MCTMRWCRRIVRVIAAARSTAASATAAPMPASPQSNPESPSEIVADAVAAASGWLVPPWPTSPRRTPPRRKGRHWRQRLSPMVFGWKRQGDKGVSAWTFAKSGTGR
jgi:hypothetical protein